MLRTSAAPVCRHHRVSDPVHQKFLPVRSRAALRVDGMPGSGISGPDTSKAPDPIQLPSKSAQLSFGVCRCFCSFAFTILYLIEIYGMDLPYNNHCPGLLRKGLQPYSRTSRPMDLCGSGSARSFSFSDSENIISRKHHMIYGFIWECLRATYRPTKKKKTDHVLTRPPELKRLLISVPSPNLNFPACSVHSYLLLSEDLQRMLCPEGLQTKP